MKRALIVLLIIAAIGAGAGAIYVRRGGAEPTVTFALFAHLVEHIAHLNRQIDTDNVRIEYLRHELLTIKRRLGLPADRPGRA